MSKMIITKCGTNLIKNSEEKTKALNIGYITIIRLYKAGTYTFSIESSEKLVDNNENSETNNYLVSAYNEHTQSIIATAVWCYGQSRQQFTFTITEEILAKQSRGVPIFLYGATSYWNSVKTECKFYNVMLEEGTTATAYEPYTLIENEVKKVMLTKIGKNLFNYDFISNYSNTITSIYIFAEIKNLKPNTDYYISGINIDYLVTVYNGKTDGILVFTRYPNYAQGVCNGVFAYHKSAGTASSSVSFTTNENGKCYIGFVKISAQWPEQTGEEHWEMVAQAYQNVQLEEGTTATAYEPYTLIENEVKKIMLGEICVYENAVSSWVHKTGSFIPVFASGQTSKDGFEISTTFTSITDFYKFFDNDTSTNASAYCEKSEIKNIDIMFPKSIKNLNLNMKTYSMSIDNYEVQSSLDGVNYTSNFTRTIGEDFQKELTDNILILNEIKYLKLIITADISNMGNQCFKGYHLQVTDWYE